MRAAESWVVSFEKVAHTVYRMKLGQIVYGPDDTDGWFLWHSHLMPPATLVNQGGYISVVHVAELSSDEAWAFLEAILCRDEDTYRGVGPYSISKAGTAFYITSQTSEDARAMTSLLNNVLGFRWRAGERQYTMVTAVQLPPIRGEVEYNRADVIPGAFAKARPVSQDREQSRRKTMDQSNIQILWVQHEMRVCRLMVDLKDYPVSYTHLTLPTKA